MPISIVECGCCHVLLNGRNLEFHDASVEYVPWRKENVRYVDCPVCGNHIYEEEQ